jgi:RHS repeat-associated protein
VDTERYFVHDGNQIVLQFDDADITHRYLWGPAVDQLLADEQYDTGDTDHDNPATETGKVLTPIVDHLGTVRHHAEYDAINDETDLLNTLTYDVYGTVTDETGTASILIGFTGRPFDKSTDLQNHLNRWYDVLVGAWISEDPKGFTARDPNLYRYVGNQSTLLADPTGLDPLEDALNKLKGLNEELEKLQKNRDLDAELKKELRREIDCDIKDTQKQIRQLRKANEVADEQKRMRQHAHGDPLDAQKSFDQAKEKGNVPDYFDSNKTDQAAKQAAENIAHDAAADAAAKTKKVADAAAEASEKGTKRLLRKAKGRCLVLLALSSASHVFPPMRKPRVLAAPWRTKFLIPCRFSNGLRRSRNCPLARIGFPRRARRAFSTGKEPLPSKSTTIALRARPWCPPLKDFEKFALCDPATPC